MEENKSKKINVRTIIYIFVIVLLIIALVVVYYWENVKNNEKIAELENSHKEAIKILEKEKSELEKELNILYMYTDTAKEGKEIKDYVVLYGDVRIDKQYGSFFSESGGYEENSIDNTITYYNYGNGEYLGETKGNSNGEISISEKYNAIPRKYEKIDGKDIDQDGYKRMISYTAINEEINKIDLDGNGEDEYIVSYTLPFDVKDRLDNPDVEYNYNYNLLLSHIVIYDSNFFKIATLAKLESNSDVELSLEKHVEYIDIDKDGKMEIILEIPGWEWRNIEVFKYNNDTVLGNIGEYYYASWRHGA